MCSVQTRQIAHQLSGHLITNTKLSLCVTLLDSVTFGAVALRLLKIYDFRRQPTRPLVQGDQPPTNILGKLVLSGKFIQSPTTQSPSPGGSIPPPSKSVVLGDQGSPNFAWDVKN